MQRPAISKGCYRQRLDQAPHLEDAGYLLSDQDHYDETAVFPTQEFGGKSLQVCLLCQDENYIVAVTVDNSFYLQSTVF